MIGFSGLFIQRNGNQIVKVDNPVTELDVDIVIDEGMDTPTVAAEQFDTLLKTLPALGPVAQTPAALKMIIEASQLRNKDKLLENLEEGGNEIPPEVQQQMAEMQQAVQQLGQENEALKMDREGQAADRQIKGAELELKGREIEQKDEELKLDAYRAQTERLQAMKPDPKQEAA